MEEFEQEIKNVYLDFQKNRENLLRNIKHILRTYPEEFKNFYDYTSRPKLNDETLEKFLNNFIENIFPEGFPGTYYISNTSLKEGFFDYSIRPQVQGPRLEELFDSRLALCVRGHPAPSNIIYVDSITDIPNYSDKKDFEAEVTFVPFHSGEKIHGIRKNHLFTYDFSSSLPTISKKTKEALRSWKEYLDWKEKIIQRKLTGVRYVKFELIADKIAFIALVDGEDSFKEHDKFFKRNDVMAFSSNYSTDQWYFSHNNQERNIVSFELGDYVSGKIVSEIPSEKKGKCPFQHPYFAKFLFELPDEFHDDHEVLDNEVKERVNDIILEQCPSEGFIANSLIGDFILISRQRRVIDSLSKKSSYSPFLLSWLFDISKADKPLIASSYEITNWLKTSLNDQQKEAVRSMLTVQDIFLTQGPPGTGKTTVIAEAIYQFVKRGMKVLLVSQANLAVDNALNELESVQDIRAIRLGKNSKISKDGEKFTKEKVLGNYYQSIANTCQSTYIDTWRSIDCQINGLNQWLEKFSFIIQDVREKEDTLSDLREQKERAQREYREEQKKYYELKETNRRIAEEKEYLKTLKAFISENDGDRAFLIPEEILEFIWEAIILPINELREHGININKYWHVYDDSLSQGQKTDFVKEILKECNRIIKLKPKIESDLINLQQSDKKISDPSINLKLQRLNNEIKEIERKMDEENEGNIALLSQWRMKRKEIKLLEKNSTLDVSIYATIFTKLDKYENIHFYKKLVDPDAEKEFIVSHLSKTLNSLDTLVSTLENAKNETISRIDALQATLKESEVDSDSLKSMESNTNRLKYACEELEKSVDHKRRDLQNEINRLEELGILVPEGENNLNLIEDLVKETINKRIDDQNYHKDFRAKWEPFIQTWINRLQNPYNVKSDNEYFLETYIENANVIGVTCNEDTKTLKEWNHTFFDVAIIDEVSKATPPELLMAMMMSKKTILVGDHRQLPPLFKENRGAWKEVIEQQIEELEDGEAEENDLLSEENFDKYEQLITASLFKEHFEKADETLKTYLNKQYRMHPDIMNVINHFYEYQLEEGISEIKEKREHNLVIESPDGQDFITPDRHAIWIDSSQTPLNKKHYEEQIKTSKVNMLEILLLIETLKKINNACKKQGYDEKNPKDVGVISFYGKQVGELKRRVNELRQKGYRAIRVNVNTVDRFQGRQNSIIMVSLVRNKNTKFKSHRAFVAQFERINVAFSRAKELLLIFGAKEMFYNYDIKLPFINKPGCEVKKVYGDIIEYLKRKACFWESSRVISPKEFEVIKSGYKIK